MKNLDFCRLLGGRIFLASNPVIAAATWPSGSYFERAGRAKPRAGRNRQLHSSSAGGKFEQVGIAGDGVVMPALVAATPAFVP